MITVEKKLYDAVFLVCKQNGWNPKDTLPDDAEKYPFVVLSETQYVPKFTTDGLYGKVYITLDFWGDKKQRQIISNRVNECLYDLARFDFVEIQVVLQPEASIISIRPETNSGSPNAVTYSLIRGHVQLEYTIHQRR